MMQKVVRGHCFWGKKRYRTVKSLKNSEKQVFFTKIKFFSIFFAFCVHGWRTRLTVALSTADGQIRRNVHGRGGFGTRTFVHDRKTRPWFFSSTK